MPNWLLAKVIGDGSRLPRHGVGARENIDRAKNVILDSKGMMFDTFPKTLNVCLSCDPEELILYELAGDEGQVSLCRFSVNFGIARMLPKSCTKIEAFIRGSLPEGVNLADFFRDTVARNHQVLISLMREPFLRLLTNPRLRNRAHDEKEEYENSKDNDGVRALLWKPS